MRSERAGWDDVSQQVQNQLNLLYKRTTRVEEKEAR